MRGRSGHPSQAWAHAVERSMQCQAASLACLSASQQGGRALGAHTQQQMLIGVLIPHDKACNS